MQEIPSHHVQPLHPNCDTWCEFPVADRPNAVKQFLAAAANDTSLIKAPWILLIETDYVWMNPLKQIPAAESRDSAVAFPYGYIQPAYPGTKSELLLFCAVAVLSVVLPVVIGNNRADVRALIGLHAAKWRHSLNVIHTAAGLARASLLFPGTPGPCNQLRTRFCHACNGSGTACGTCLGIARAPCRAMAGFLVGIV